MESARCHQCDGDVFKGINFRLLSGVFAPPLRMCASIGYAGSPLGHGVQVGYLRDDLSARAGARVCSRVARSEKRKMGNGNNNAKEHAERKACSCSQNVKQ